MNRPGGSLDAGARSKHARIRGSTVGLSIGLTLLIALAIAVDARKAEAVIDDTAFIQLWYSDLLDRSADTEGQAAWVSALQSGAISRRGAASAFLESVEYDGRVVQALYARLLGRSIDEGGTGFVGVLQHGAIREQVMASILGSAEYFTNRGGGTDRGFLTALYQDVLHRDADSSGLAQFTALLANGVSRANVALIMLQSREARVLLLDNLYQKLLQRTIEAAGREAWIAFLVNGGTVEDVIAGIVASEEYYNLDRSGQAIGSVLLDPFGPVSQGGGTATSSTAASLSSSLLDTTTLPDLDTEPLTFDGPADQGATVAAIPQPRSLGLVTAGFLLLLTYGYMRRAPRAAAARAR